MCPGGFVVPAASGPEQIVVNGMSPSNRGSVWANSGMVVELQPEDFGARFSMFGVLAGIKFQEDLERQCYLNGNCKQTAPAQRMTDFVNRRNSFDLPRSSYSPDSLLRRCISGCPILSSPGCRKDSNILGTYLMDSSPGKP